MKKLILTLLLSSLIAVACTPGTASEPVEATSTPASTLTASPTPAPEALLLLAELTGTTGPVYSLDWSPIETILVSAGYGQVNLWDTTGYSFLTNLEGHDGFVWSVAWSPDGGQIASGSQDRTLRSWDFATLAPALNIDDDWTFCVDWSPDGTLLVAGTSTGRLTVRDVLSGVPVMILKRSSSPIDQSAIISTGWSPDGAQIAAGHLNGDIIFWDSASGERLGTFDEYTTHRSDTNGLAWSPDSRFLATAHQDGIVRLWDAVTYALVRELRSSIGWARGVAWSSDGSRLATGGQDGEVRVWDPASGQLLAIYPTIRRPVWSLAWSPDGSRLAAGDGLYDNAHATSSIFILAMP